MTCPERKKKKKEEEEIKKEPLLKGDTETQGTDNLAKKGRRNVKKECPGTTTQRGGLPGPRDTCWREGKSGKTQKRQKTQMPSIGDYTSNNKVKETRIRKTSGSPLQTVKARGMSQEAWRLLCTGGGSKGETGENIQIPSTLPGKRHNIRATGKENNSHATAPPKRESGMFVTRGVSIQGTTKREKRKEKRFILKCNAF